MARSPGETGTAGAAGERVARTSTVTLTCAVSRDEIRALQPAMDALWHRAAATPFQHPGWWMPWIDCFDVVDPVVVVSWREEMAVGALALSRTLEADGPVARVLGCGNSDYLDAVVADAADLETTRALASWIDELDARVDVLDVPPGATIEPILDQCRRTVSWGACARCPIVDLPADAATWRASLPHGLARNLRRYDLHLAEAGPTTIERIESREIQRGLDAFFTLHAARWRGRGEAGVLADAAVAAFHRASIPWLVDAGVGRLFVMRHAGAPIAVQYVLIAGDRAFSYLSGFDPAFARFSPGALLMAHAIEDAIAAGCRTFDLLRGEEPYKASWAGRVIETRRATLARGGRPPSIGPGESCVSTGSAPGDWDA
jgi:CelD/BcsL family acetyltransferase involved in cellulose biosynthesis